MLLLLVFQQVLSSWCLHYVFVSMLEMSTDDRTTQHKIFPSSTTTPLAANSAAKASFAACSCKTKQQAVASSGQDEKMCHIG
jgi:SNF family Na+-dependent transporter